MHNCWQSGNETGLSMLQKRSAKIKSRPENWDTTVHETANARPECAGGWPSFQSLADLQADPWGTYFSFLYGEISDMGFPLCVGDFWMFYGDLLSQAGVTNIPESEGDCPRGAYSHYKSNNFYAPGGVSWSWHPGPWHGWPNNSWVEVIHRAESGGIEDHGGWMLYAKGSGVWLNLGRTVVFAEYDEVFDRFAKDEHTAEDWSEENQGTPFTKMIANAIAQGYDSIQLVNHPDSAYSACGNRGDLSPAMNVEIISLRATGTFACMAEQGTFEQLRVGWQGRMGKCDCDASKEHLNCKRFIH